MVFGFTFSDFKLRNVSFLYTGLWCSYSARFYKSTLFPQEPSDTIQGREIWICKWWLVLVKLHILIYYLPLDVLFNPRRQSQKRMLLFSLLLKLSLTQNSTSVTVVVLMSTRPSYQFLVAIRSLGATSVAAPSITPTLSSPPHTTLPANIRTTTLPFTTHEP